VVGANHSASNSPYVNDENVDVSCSSYHVATPSIAGAKVLQDSPRKTNAAILSLSPLKMDLRQKMAAWAENKVKTPQSPEKKEWERMLESIGPSAGSLSPSVANSAQRLAVYELARTVPLPHSPEKKEERFINAHRQAEHTLQAQHRAGPLVSSLKANNEREEQVPPPSQTRLPRPMKVLPASRPGAASAIRAPNSSAHLSKAQVPVKRTFSSQLSSVNRLSTAKAQPTTFHRSLPSTSSSSTTSSSPGLPSVRRTKAVANTSSSPTKLVKAVPTIVRDARLIASRRQDGETAVVSTMKANNGDLQPSSEALQVDKLHEPATVSIAVRVPIAPSAGVGGARRVALASTTQKPMHVQTREQGRSISLRASQDEVGKSGTGKAMPVRTMRRVNDYAQHPSIPEKAMVVEEKKPLSMAKTVASRDVFRAVPVVPLQRSLHTQQPVGVVSPPQEPAESQAEEDVLDAGRGLGDVQRTTSSAAHANTTRILPLSSAELSKLTSLHTQCNEASVVQIRLVVIRKHGEVRPASPSSKFRKASLVASSNSKSERLAREAQDRGNRAAQRSARFSGESNSDSEDDKMNADADDSQDLMPGAFRRAAVHRRGAGDDEPYTSPIRRVSLKKAVRWHRALFEHGQKTLRDTQLRSSSEAVKPRHSCLRESCRALSLDRFGNVAKAGKPLKSTNVKQQVVRVARIVYDDDDVPESGDT
jgi:hypothetical protein